MDDCAFNVLSQIYIDDAMSLSTTMCWYMFVYHGTPYSCASCMPSRGEMVICRDVLVMNVV